MSKKFALIGAAGFVAPRHMKAIHETSSRLLAALDPHDAVGVLDQYFPQASFFTEFERFDRHLEKLKRAGQSIDYVSVCSPNYLHDAHIRFGLRHGADVICEKPMVLNPKNIQPLIDIEKETGSRVFHILQLRHHPSVLALKEKIDKDTSGKIYDIDLTYITSRGHWYFTSWKGQPEKSGGIAANIGIHFFDMLTWIFGDVQKQTVHLHSFDRAAGFMQCGRANIRWFLSIQEDTLPQSIQEAGKRTYRSLKIEGEEWEFSDGFTDLHTISYQHILQGKGFTTEEAKKGVEVAFDIRNQVPIGCIGEYHPLCILPQGKHPFL